MTDPEILAVRGKVRLIPDPELQKLMPRRTGTVEITTADGSELSHHTPAVLGTKDRPMTGDQVAEKALELIAPETGETRAQAIVEAVWTLDATADVRSLRPLLGAGG